MGYRIAKTIAPQCRVFSEVCATFEEAYEKYLREDSNPSNSFVDIEEEKDGKWVELSHYEIALKRYTEVEIKTITIGTETHNYTFTLPRAVRVPNNLADRDICSFIALSLLCNTLKREKTKEK